MTTTTTITSRAFNQDSGKAKKAAAHGPVIITDRGRPSHVLLSIAEYRRLSEDEFASGGTLRPAPDRNTRTEPSIADLLSANVEDGIDFDPPRFTGVSKPFDFDAE